MKLFFFLLITLIYGFDDAREPKSGYENDPVDAPVDVTSAAINHLIGDPLKVQKSDIRVRGAKARKERKQKQQQTTTTTTPAVVATEKPESDGKKSKATEEERQRVLMATDLNPDKPWVPKAATPEDISAIKTRMLDVVSQANRWIFHNIGKHSDRDSMKAKRLVNRFNELPERYMKVIERCRDPKTLPKLEEIRRSRPQRIEERTLAKQERRILQEEKSKMRLEKENKKKQNAEKGKKDDFEESPEPEITVGRARRQADQQRIARQAKDGKPKREGKKFRPGRVLRRPERYYQFLSRQIHQRKLQRNELKCDIELYPECGVKGRKGAEARKQWRPDSKEAMWTKIIRALRLAPLEVRAECHIWERIDKKTSKLKAKSHKLYVAARDSNDDGTEKESKKQILLQQQQQRNQNN